MNTQEQVFINQEADNWFLRNKNTIIAKQNKNDYCFNIIKNTLDCAKITSVLELGCSNGYRLNFLKSIFPNCTKFVGSDASKLAVEDGIERYGLELYQSSLCNFTYPEQFDLVIVSFVLHWIDRTLLYKSIATIDSLLKNNAYLCLNDFFPYFPHKRIYHHYTKDPVYTYKLDYNALFTSSNYYQLLQEYIYIYSDAPTMDNDTRCHVSLLQKNDFL